MDKENVNFVQWLEQYLIKHNLPNRYICDLTGISESSISRYLSRERIPSDKTRKKILSSLGLNDSFEMIEKENREMKESFYDLQQKILVMKDYLSVEQRLHLISLLSK